MEHRQKFVFNPLQNYLLDSAHYKYNRIHDGGWGNDLNTIDIKEDSINTSENMKKEVKFFSEDKLKKVEQMKEKALQQNIVKKLNASFSHYDSGEEKSREIKRKKDTNIDSFEVTMKNLKTSEQKLKYKMQSLFSKLNLEENQQLQQISEILSNQFQQQSNNLSLNQLTGIISPTTVQKLMKTQDVENQITKREDRGFENQEYQAQQFSNKKNQKYLDLIQENKDQGVFQESQPSSFIKSEMEDTKFMNDQRKQRSLQNIKQDIISIKDFQLKKMKQEMEKTINRIEKQKERTERLRFNNSFALNDKSMAPLRGIMNLKSRQMTSATDNKIEVKQMVRRQRNLLKEQIQLMESQIKKMKKKIKTQASNNQVIDEQIEQQLLIQTRLYQLSNPSPLAINTSPSKVQDRSIEEQTLMRSQASGFVSDMQKKRIAKILKNSNSISFNSAENRSASNLLKMKSLMIQQLYEPLKQAASQTTLTNESNKNLSTIKHQQSSFIIGNVKNISQQPNNQFQTFTSEEPETFQTQVDHSVLKFYKNFIEDDISNNFNKLKTDLIESKETNFILASEIDYYKTENQTLRNICNRYRQMQKELENSQTKFNDKSFNDTSVYSDSIRSVRKIIKVDSQSEIAMNRIEQEMYKYGKYSKGDFDRESDNSYFGRLTNNTPMTFAPMPQFTNQSFILRNNPQIFEMKKINQINNFLMPKVFKAPKMYDSIQEFLVQIKQIFKPQKLTLFMLDANLQKTLFQGSNERRQNYRKIQVNTGLMSKQQESQITAFAIFESKNEFMLPLFRDLDEAGKLIFNNKTILIPMKNKNQETLMTLQLVYDINMKVLKQQRKANIKTQSSFQSRPSSVQILKLSATKQQESSDRHKSISPHLGKTLQISKKNKNQKQELQGWSINDYSVLKILAQYLQMNIEILEAFKIQKQKEDKKLEFIKFTGEIACIQTYRQLIKKVENCSKQILGFDHVSLFFLDDELQEIFTITNVDVVEEMKKMSGPTKYDTSFAQDLLLSQEQTVVFPSTLGITGEVFAHVGIRFQNDVNLIGKSKIGGLDDIDDSKSLQSQISENSTKKLLKNSFKKQIQRQQTNLEKIKEDQPHKESEDQAIWFKRNTIYSVSDNQKKSQLLTPINYPTILNDIGEVNLQSPQEQMDQIKIADSFTNEIKNNLKKQKLNSLLEKTKIDKILSENTFDFSNETIKVETRNHKLIQTIQSTKKTEIKKNEPRYISEFLPDIDNFLGVEKIQNYVIVALREDAYNFGDESKGVMMLFNKSDKTDVKREDLERIIHFSKLFGGLSRKAKAIIDTLTMVIGVDVNKMPVLQEASKIDSTPGQGEFQQVSLCVQTIAKLLSTLSEVN